MYGHATGLGTVSTGAVAGTGAGFPYGFATAAKASKTLPSAPYIPYMKNNLMVCDLATKGTSAVIVIPVLRANDDNDKAKKTDLVDTDGSLWANSLPAFVLFAKTAYTPDTESGATKIGYPVLWGSDRYLS